MSTLIKNTLSTPVYDLTRPCCYVHLSLNPSVSVFYVDAIPDELWDIRSLLATMDLIDIKYSDRESYWIAQCNAYPSVVSSGLGMSANFVATYYDKIAFDWFALSSNPGFVNSTNLSTIINTYKGLVSTVGLTQNTMLQAYNYECIKCMREDSYFTNVYVPLCVDKMCVVGDDGKYGKDILDDDDDDLYTDIDSTSDSLGVCTGSQ